MTLWVVESRRLSWGPPWYMYWTMSQRRRDSIKLFDEWMGERAPPSRRYRQSRRRGEVRCVKVRIVPVEGGET